MRSHEGLPWLRNGASRSAIACAVAMLVASPALVEAKEAAKNLGGGLEQLASPASRTQATAVGQQAFSSGARLAASEEEESNLELTYPIQFDNAGRALIRISLDGKVPGATVLQGLRSTPNVEVTASDMSYRAGVIEAYVPQAASADEVAKAVEAAVAETGATSMKDMGTVMKAAMAKLQGKSADGKMVSEAVKAKLS
jgi:hypothetical protein